MGAAVRNRVLIVNADDFGQSPGVNEGVARAHEHGIVSSASLMVRWPAAAAAAEYGRAHPALSLGIHFDFSEWACHDGEWSPIYEVVQLEDAAAVAGEVQRQLACFRQLVGRDPTHLDSHQHAHRREPVRSILRQLARELCVPLRSYSRRVRYYGGFYGQQSDGTPLPDFTSVEHLVQVLTDLQAGVTELGCHPALRVDLNTMYGAERLREVASLCDPRVRSALVELGIELRSFAEVGRGYLTSKGDRQRR